MITEPLVKIRLIKISLAMGLVLIIIGLGFGLWSRTVDAPTASVTGEVSTSRVDYFQSATGYLAEPKRSGEYPGVIVIHDRQGLRPQVEVVAEDLAAAGYRVLAVDLFNGEVASTEAEASALSSQYNFEAGLENLTAAVAYLRRSGSEKVAVLGWGFGGEAALTLAMSTASVDATVVYYGRPPSGREQWARLQGSLLGIFGDQDTVVPVETVDAFKDGLDEFGIQSDVRIYLGMGHAFTDPDSPNFSPEAAADAWQRTLDFLTTNLR